MNSRMMSFPPSITGLSKQLYICVPSYFQFFSTFAIYPFMLEFMPSGKSVKYMAGLPADEQSFLT